MFDRFTDTDKGLLGMIGGGRLDSYRPVTSEQAMQFGVETAAIELVQIGMAGIGEVNDNCIEDFGIAEQLIDLDKGVPKADLDSRITECVLVKIQQGLVDDLSLNLTRLAKKVDQLGIAVNQNHLFWIPTQ